MNVSASPIKKSELEFDVAVPHEEFEPYAKRAAARISEERDFEGFRKGKAPYEIVKKTVGEQAIYERAADLAVRAMYGDALREALQKSQIDPEKNETPIGHPEITITKVAPGNELQFKAKVSLMPSVPLPDYRAIARETKTRETKDVSVKEEEVAAAIDWLLDSRATEIAVSRPAQNGDRVEIDFEIRRGGVKIENGESRNHPLVIGKGKFIPGFEENLIGMAKGETKSFTLVVPDSWRDAALRGNALDITATMKEVRERTTPALTDEFAKSVGAYESKEKLLESVRAGLLEERLAKEKERIRMRIIEEITGKTTLEIPNLLIELELNKMEDELKSGVTQMGMKWDEYLLHIKKDSAGLRADWRTEAEKRARIALVLREIASKEHIAPSEEEIQARANEFLARYKTTQDAEKEIDPDTLKEYTRGVLRNEKVFEFLESA